MYFGIKRRGGNNFGDIFKNLFGGGLDDPSEGGSSSSSSAPRRLSQGHASGAKVTSADEELD